MMLNESVSKTYVCKKAIIWCCWCECVCVCVRIYAWLSMYKISLVPILIQLIHEKSQVTECLGGEHQLWLRGCCQWSASAVRILSSQLVMLLHLCPFASQWCIFLRPVVRLWNPACSLEIACQNHTVAFVSCFLFFVLLSVIHRGKQEIVFDRKVCRAKSVQFINWPFSNPGRFLSCAHQWIIFMLVLVWGTSYIFVS